MSPSLTQSPNALPALRRQLEPLLQKKTLWQLLGIAGAVLVAVFLGLVAAILPWYFCFGLVVAITFPLVVFKAPWVALTLYVLGVFLAPGLKSADGLTLISLGLFFLRWLTTGRPFPLPGRLAKLFLLFLMAVVSSGLLGLLIHRYPLTMVYGDGRGFVPWLWLPLLYSLALSTHDGVRKLAFVLAFVTAVISLVALLQYFTGVQLVAAGRVADLDSAAGSEKRVQMHGFLFVSVATVWGLNALVESPRRGWWLVPSLFVLLAALYANFGRGLWLWTGAALALSAFAAGRQRGRVVAFVLVAVCVLGVTSLSIVKPKVIDNIVSRIESVRDEGGARTSYGWRKLENADAAPHILRNPVLGLGLGAEYRRWIHEVAQFDQHTRYVHNSYIFIALKTGLLALLSLLTLLLMSWWLGWQSTRGSDVPQWALRVAAVASFFPLLGISITQPELVSPMSVILFVSLAVLMASGQPASGSAASDASPKRTGWTPQMAAARSVGEP